MLKNRGPVQAKRAAYLWAWPCLGHYEKGHLNGSRSENGEQMCFRTSAKSDRAYPPWVCEANLSFYFYFLASVLHSDS
jgi:hypothetical protein